MHKLIAALVATLFAGAVIAQGAGRTSGRSGQSTRSAGCRCACFGRACCGCTRPDREGGSQEGSEESRRQRQGKG
jgi:hypothetical protein